MATVRAIESGKPAGITTLEELMPSLQSMYEKGIVRGVDTGWATLDEFYRAQGGQCTFVTGIPSHGKALALDTPIPTTTGWSTMGTIAVGDRVFDEQGVPCVVTHVTEVMEGHPCYEMEFADGTTVVCDADHEWVTRTDKARRSDRNTRSVRRVAQRLSGRSIHGTDQSHKRTFPTAVTTADIARSILSPSDPCRFNHAVAVAGALDTPEIALPIAPYVLGAWLGDGSSNGAVIATDDKDVLREIEAEGFVTSPWRAKFMHGILGLSPLLRQYGLMNNKHIPLPYFRASASQRLALLQGLMDTDGYISPEYGVCEFSNTKRCLAEGVFELVASLGWKPGFAEGEATLHGRVVSDKFRVTFTPNQSVFRLPRKAKFTNYNPSPRVHWRSIVRCDPCESVPVRCIKVSSSSSLYLCTKAMIPTHNTRFISHLMLKIMERHDWKFAAFSPEASPARYVKLLLEQYTGKSFDLVPDRWRNIQPAVERMSEPEMYEAHQWLSDHLTMITPKRGENSIPGMLEIAKRQVEYEGVKGIILDPWSWIAKKPAHGQALTNYVGEQLAMIEEFCVWSDCHLWLIAHPVKLQKKDKGPYEGLYEPPDLYCIADSAHFYNFAFMGMTVWRNTEISPAPPDTEIHVTKCKFEENGRTGKVVLMYDKYTKRYFDAGTEPVRTYAGY